MCTAECFGNFYRGCGHYIRTYYTGYHTDCESPACGLSKSHMHKTATTCLCTKTYTDNRRVTNTFQARCDYCVEADRARGRQR